MRHKLHDCLFVMNLMSDRTPHTMKCPSENWKNLYAAMEVVSIPVVSTRRKKGRTIICNDILLYAYAATCDQLVNQYKLQSIVGCDATDIRIASKAKAANGAALRWYLLVLILIVRCAWTWTDTSLRSVQHMDTDIRQSQQMNRTMSIGDDEWAHTMMKSMTRDGQ